MSFFLTKKQILKYIEAGDIVIEPKPTEEQLTPVGIDFRLDNLFREFRSSRQGILDVTDVISEEEHYELHNPKIEPKGDSLNIEPIVLHRGEFIIGQTLEYLCIPQDIMGFLDGRSSLARRGVVIHAMAGSIEPDFRGHITLELGNIGKLPVRLYPLMRIAALHLAVVGENEGYRGQFQFQVKLKPPKPDADLLKLLGRTTKNLNN